MANELQSSQAAVNWDLPHTDREALDLLFSVAYEELRRLASTLRHAHPSATLSPTTLVNEAWIKLSKTPAVSGVSPLHFRRIAARAMRQVLVTAARRRNADKRQALILSLEDYPSAAIACDEQLVRLDDALEELAAMNPRHAVIVESRFFGGLDVSQITELLGVSEATVLRDWRAARAWLAQQLSAGTTHAPHGS